MPPFCALCRTNTDLQNSHIIPEFFYRLICDSTPRRFHVFSGDPSERERFAQKGLRESLLCPACEQKVGRWEHQSKTAFLDGKGLRTTSQGDRVLLQGLDYKTFKLFQMSLLWRMSVSSLPFFKEVDLGPHEEPLRQALLNNDPLRPDQYACWMIAIEIDGKRVLDWMLEPSLTRLDIGREYTQRSKEFYSKAPLGALVADLAAEEEMLQPNLLTEQAPEPLLRVQKVFTMLFSDPFEIWEEIARQWSTSASDHLRK